ncbi:MAG: GNAT family N-acetyltransferase [Lachnospiraceae bacterium]|nr:GNAT family N-acetyltransferase [Lachnospiraceae bacterium]
MNYIYTTNVKDNDTLRASFNELTRQVFGFDFVNWYETGHWGNMYIPHVLLDGDKVIANVSVNLMQFAIGDVKKNYIQLGTVMTHPDYRNQGLGREIMERIMEEYTGKVDGMYLFGNDSVLEYYPKFGFKPAKEYEYYMPCEKQEGVAAYQLEKVDMSNSANSEKLYDKIRACMDDNKELTENSLLQDSVSGKANSAIVNQNDGLYMNENIGLYQFWIAAEYGEQIYYLPETGNYVIAAVEENTLHIYQIFGKQKADMKRLAKAFGENVKEVELHYTPACKEEYAVREHKEEDCTLFIMGEDLERIEKDMMMFPELSHA